MPDRINFTSFSSVNYFVIILGEGFGNYQCREVASWTYLLVLPCHLQNWLLDGHVLATGWPTFRGDISLTIKWLEEPDATIIDRWLLRESSSLFEFAFCFRI